MPDEAEVQPCNALARQTCHQVSGRSRSKSLPDLNQLIRFHRIVFLGQYHALLYGISFPFHASSLRASAFINNMTEGIPLEEKILSLGVELNTCICKYVVVVNDDSLSC